MEKNSLINSLKTKEPYLEIKTLLKNCTHKQQVQFALLAAKSAGEFYDKSKYPEVHASRLKVFEVLEKWLENPKSISEKELNDTAYVARAASNAANAARAAANVNENKHLEFLLFELIKLIAIDKGYSIAALEVLYGKN